LSLIDKLKDEESVKNRIKALVGTYLISKHGNIGRISTIYHLVTENNNEIHEDTNWKFFNLLFAHANHHQIRKVVIPIENLMTGRFKLMSLRNCAEVSQKLFSSLRTELNNLAHDATISTSVRKVTLILPKGLEDSQSVFNKVKDILMKTFE